MSPRLQSLISRLRAGEVLLADGAWGTRMQTIGLQPGDCPEEWNLTRPDDIRRIAREYFEAGADFCLTNTFGANRYRLVRHGFADKVREFNREVPDAYKRPGSWMIDALEVRDQWESRLLRVSGWSPLG